MTLGEFKKKWEEVIRTLTEDDFARVFERWLNRCKKCVRIGGGYVEKSYEMHFVFNLNRFCFNCLVYFVPECTPYL
jgi:hypothetical protein